MYILFFLSKIPQDSNSADPTKSQMQVITSLTVSPSEETLVASTDLSQLYYITLSSADIGKVSDSISTAEKTWTLFAAFDGMVISFLLKKNIILFNRRLGLRVY